MGQNPEFIVGLSPCRLGVLESIVDSSLSLEILFLYP